MLISELSLEWYQIDAMHWLVRDAKPDDSYFFHCTLISHLCVDHVMHLYSVSGHGGQTKDPDGDEEDGYDKGMHIEL